uniref:Transcription factor CBF/NF-Y/archaeal histone domain-containing protein n=1 Tax=Candidozyma auris TaxID=498019 RepID=A0A0L0P1E0_CANAR
MADISSLINPPDEKEEQAPVTTPQEEKVSEDTILASFDKIKTHFPAARIKKIMQSDEEIGKVAQATPIVVGRALEIFMANLVEAAIKEAKAAGVRRIAASHVRAAVENTEQFDFLVDAVLKYQSK